MRTAPQVSHTTQGEPNETFSDAAHIRRVPPADVLPLSEPTSMRRASSRVHRMLYGEHPALFRARMLDLAAGTAPPLRRTRAA